MEMRASLLWYFTVRSLNRPGQTAFDAGAETRQSEKKITFNQFKITQVVQPTLILPNICIL